MKKSEVTHVELKAKKNESVLEKCDIQAIITRGYDQLKAAFYILIQIDNPKQAKQYFKWLLEDKKITTADVSGKKLQGSTDPENAVNIAFTSSGLEKLDMPVNVLNTFSREFHEGISYVDEKNQIEERSTLLGDTGNSDPRNWYWGNLEKGKRVDCLLMLFAPDGKKLQDLKKEVYDDRKENGVKEVYLAETYEYKSGVRKEHFGFTDGISQPFIKSFSSRQDNKKFSENSEEVKAGEFILGYKNTYGDYSRSPYVEDNDGNTELDIWLSNKGKKDLGKNGTYLVFRQIEQHVEDFWNFQYENSKEVGASLLEKAIKLAAKMIGRWPNGLPLVTHPVPGCPTKEDLNDFKYRALDKEGVNCPLGAHIRRTNPRDQTHAGRGSENSLEVSGKHRMLRRGRIYGEPLDENMDIENMVNTAQKHPAPVKRGLHFICFVSDISRQFEFVQSVWANTSTFGDLCNEVDQVIAPRPTKLQPHCNEFTTPQKIIRNRYTNVPEFTTVVGGGYFFLPGIKTLKYIIT